MTGFTTTLASYLRFNKSSSKEKKWVQAPVIKVKFDFVNARNENDRLNIVNNTLQEALANYGSENIPLIHVSIENLGSDPNKSNILAATLAYLENVKTLVPQGILLDIRPLGNIGLNADLKQLLDLMQKNIVKEAKVDRISCNKNHKESRLTYSKIKEGGLHLVFASKSFSKENTQTIASPPPTVQPIAVP
jgi:hypothetical protein